MSLSKVLAGVAYRVRHPEFSRDRAYEAQGLLDYGESSWGYIVFINERGMTYSVRQDRCAALDPLVFSLHLEPDQAELPWPVPTGKNPDQEALG